MITKKQERILFVIVFLLFALWFTLDVLSSLKEAEVMIEKCQERGYYGIRYEGWFRNEIKCSNLTVEEEIRLELEG